jgi:Ca-activated chloride channel family protein
MARKTAGAARPVLLVLLLLVPAVPSLTLAQAQVPPDDETQQEILEEAVAEEGGLADEEGGPKRLDSPWDAYHAQVYDQALQGFVDEQVERPEDPALTFNIASAHYQMKNYEEAEKSFATVAMAGDPALREQAFYNLGNCAYRQGKLQEAVELYKAALEVDPDDEDAKFNLEFVRDEIRRRHEEQQKRQQEQQQQDQQQDQQQQQQQQQQQGGQDSDRDGLPDETERSAENETDPHDADSDDDGLLDGQEDRNANGKVDDGETDPNNPDSDGDGKSDGQEALEQQDPEQQQEQQGEPQPDELEGLSEEEAERYLQSLEEGRPDQQRKQKGRPRRPAKDW